VAVVIPVLFIIAWLIGCLIDTASFHFGSKIWKFTTGHDAEIKYKNLVRNVPYEDRKLEKHLAESAMFRNLFGVFMSALLWKSIIGLPLLFASDHHENVWPLLKQIGAYVLGAIISFAAFYIYRKRSHKLVATAEKVMKHKP
jgi:hypothetical protein